MFLQPVGPASLTPNLRFGEITYLSANATDPKAIPTIQLTKDLLVENSQLKDELAISAARGLDPELMTPAQRTLNVVDAVHITGPDAYDFFEKAYNIHPALIPSGAIKLHEWQAIAPLSLGIKQFLKDTLVSLNPDTTGGPGSDKIFQYLAFRQHQNGQQPIHVSGREPINIIA